MSQVTPSCEFACLGISTVTVYGALSFRGCGDSYNCCKHFKVYLNNLSSIVNSLNGYKSCYLFIVLNSFLALFFHSIYNLHIVLWLFMAVYLSGGSGQIVRVKQVDVILGSQQKTTSLLIQQQRLRVEAIGGAQKQRYTASFQQFWPRESDTQTRRQTKRLIHPCSTVYAHM